MSEKKLERLSKKWKELKEKIESVESDIQKEILKKKESVHLNEVYMKYYGGKSSTSWDELAKEKGVSFEIVDKHRTITEKIDWKKICAEAGYSEEEVKKHTSIGNPSVKIEIKK